jgi:riboflavin synthase
VFSGIVETISPILSIEDSKGQRKFLVGTPRGWKLNSGESISIEGVCSTIQKVNRKAFEVIYMPETLRRTTLGNFRPGRKVNLERSLTLQSLIGGHLVQGHIDTTAQIRKIYNDGNAKIFEFQLPARFSRYLVEKGSVAVDGVSLTVMSIRPGRFRVSLLEYTLGHTTLGEKGLGERVNIELDILAKYVEKLLRR